MLEAATRTLVKFTVACPLLEVKVEVPSRLSPASTTPFPLVSAQTATAVIPVASSPLPEAETLRLVTLTGTVPVLSNRT